MPPYVEMHDCLSGMTVRDRWEAADHEYSWTTFDHPHTHVFVVSVTGALRTPLTSTLRQVLESYIGAGEPRVLLDLSGVSDIDAAGVGELVWLFNRIMAAGGVLQVAGANEHVRRVLEIAGLWWLLTANVALPKTDREAVVSLVADRTVVDLRRRCSRS